jgi:hypothetical protein
MMARIFQPWIATCSRVDQILRGDLIRSKGASAAKSWHLWSILIASGCCYGAVLGSFSGGGSPRVIQMIYSAAKVPLLLLVTFWLTLPSFFVINTLLGLRSDFDASLKALGSSQAVLTIILASLAPLTAIWYLSEPDYTDAIFFNAAMFLIASGAAQVSLRRAYCPLMMRNPRHRWMLRVWLLVYALVGIQMGWVLRPFIGDPNLPTTFFRRGAFTNAYMFLIQMVVGKMG